MTIYDESNPKPNQHSTNLGRTQNAAMQKYWDLREVIIRVAKEHDKYKGKNDAANRVLVALNDLLQSGNKQSAIHEICEALTVAQSAPQSENAAKPHTTTGK